MSQDASTKKKRAPATKFPCGNCNKTTSGCMALMCNICEYWHHTDCIPGITEQFFKMMVSMKESLGYSFFICPKCDKVHKKTWQSINKFGDRLDAVEKRLSAIEESLKLSSEKADKAINDVAKVEQATLVKSDDLTNTVLTELEDQKNRKSNIIVYNLAESPETEATVRKDHDTTKSIELCNIIGFDISDEITSIRRLGKKDPVSSVNGDAQNTEAKPRPLLLSFRDTQLQMKILKNAKKLAKTTYDHVSICPDLTKSQQQQDKSFRKEIDDLNTEEPEDDNGAFLWKVIGIPGLNRRKIKIYKTV